MLDESVLVHHAIYTPEDCIDVVSASDRHMARFRGRLTWTDPPNAGYRGRTRYVAPSQEGATWPASPAEAARDRPGTCLVTLAAEGKVS